MTNLLLLLHYSSFQLRPCPSTRRRRGTLFDTRGTRRTRRDGTRTWSTRASLIFGLWVVVVVVVVCDCSLASWIPKIDYGEKIKTRRDEEEEEEEEEAHHQARRRREGREKRPRKEGRKQRWVSWSFLSTTFSLPLWDPCSSESASTKANPLTCSTLRW